ncbi:Choline kinase [Alteromonas sp. 38]|uniref:phosphotransferase n=1 Tax=Alteromonas TaxID=226 RepID=UPI0012F15D67|nr:MULTISPECIES: phosphotransferase [Alteromonas]CAD5284729.1 Choline kinase [Alteromonas sp. 154]VXB41711.1 Choline kinase [Alteromonas sp. 38]
MKPETIIPLLKEALNLSDSATVERHPAGLVNQVYHLKDHDRGFAVKWVGEDAFSGIDRFHQFVLQQQLAERGIAPKPIWLSDDELIWVEQWEEEADPHPSIRSPEALASVLARVHGLPITARPLNLFSRWLHYMHTAGLKAGDVLFERAIQLRASLVESEGNTDDYVLCHNDLLAHHVVRDSTPFIVDWEYSAMGNRYFDVAGCAKINAMSEAEIQALAIAYAKEVGKDEDEVLAQVHLHREIVNMTNDLWLAALEGNKQNAG